MDRSESSSYGSSSGSSYSSNSSSSRDSYARGALLAAKFLAGRPAGRYSMKDVLGL